MPREESIVLPSSRCPSCGAAIAFYDNVPVLSYCMLRGRCRACKVHISARYPAVEAFTALLWVAVAWRDGLTWALPFDLVFVTAISALIFIDAEHMILPNVITYPGIVFALVARVALPYLMGKPHFDDLPMLDGWGCSRHAVLGSIADRRRRRRVGRRRLLVVDGLALGKTARHRSDGPGRRQDDVYGGRISRLATDDSDNIPRSIVRLADWRRDHSVRRRRDLKSYLPYGVYLGIGASSPCSSAIRSSTGMPASTGNYFSLHSLLQHYF